MTLSSPPTNPPSEANVLENVPITISTSLSSPNSDAVPLPPLPITPVECASSISILALYFLHSSTSFGSSTISPVVEKTPSDATSLAASIGILLSTLSRSSISLCLYLLNSANPPFAIRLAATMQA